MKHLFVWFLIFLLVAGLLFSSGCKDKEQTSGKLKIALLLPSGKDDLAWSQGMYEGLMEVQKEMGEANLEISVSEKIPNPVDAGTALRDYANRGFDIIIAHGSQYQNPVLEVAAEFPQITFAYGTAFQTAKNVFSYDPQTQQGAYLFGMLAAKITKSKVVGIVGPVKAGDAIKYNFGFRQGVEVMNSGVKILESYTGGFGDTVKAKEMATAHMDAGADILTGTAQQVVGAIQAVSEKKETYWFSNDMNQIPLAPEHIIAAQTYRWKEVVEYIIDCRKKGKLGDERIILDYLNGRLKIIFNPKLEHLMTPELKNMFNEAFDKIKKGEIKIKLPGA